MIKKVVLRMWQLEPNRLKCPKCKENLSFLGLRRNFTCDSCNIDLLSNIAVLGFISAFLTMLVGLILYIVWYEFLDMFILKAISFPIIFFIYWLLVINKLEIQIKTNEENKEEDCED